MGIVNDYQCRKNININSLCVSSRQMGNVWIYIYKRYRYIVKLSACTVLHSCMNKIYIHTKYKFKTICFLKVYSQWQNRIKYYIYICLRNNWLGLILLNIFDITWNFNQRVLLFCNILNNEKQIYYHLFFF